MLRSLCEIKIKIKMPPLTIAVVTEAIKQVILKTAWHSALAHEARQSEEFCGALAADSEDRTALFEDDLQKHEVLFNQLAELYHLGRIQPVVLAALQLQVAYRCAAETQNAQDYKEILALEGHFDLENTRQEDLVSSLEVQQIVLLAVRDELIQRQLGEEDTMLRGLDLNI